jgi:putative ATPase
MDLFEEQAPKGADVPPPLADRMRPMGLEEFVGQTHLTGEGKLLRGLIHHKEIPSLLLWGPPGTGKTTLARIVAKAIDAHFVSFSAVLSGVQEIRAVVKEAQEERRYRYRKTILFVDEIHRFNKAQQDAFLPHVENGTLTLIGATTENPSFYVNAPLLSRCKVLILEPLSEEDLKTILRRALEDQERGLGSHRIEIGKEMIDYIAAYSHGDARAGLNTLEAAVMMAEPDQIGVRRVTMEVVREAMQRKPLLYDKAYEEHYNVISAFIKSMRGSDPDAALYWLARMLTAGEDPLFIARRMVIFASEDVGNADPQAIQVAMSVKDAVDFIGLPEAWIPLAQGVTYLATAPKSNASYAAYLAAQKDVKEKGALPVPLSIRNAPTPLMKKIGYGKGYQYPHDYEEGIVPQDYRPEALRSSVYYRPKEIGHEKAIKERLEKIQETMKRPKLNHKGRRS